MVVVVVVVVVVIVVVGEGDYHSLPNDHFYTQSKKRCQSILMQVAN